MVRCARDVHLYRAEVNRDGSQILHIHMNETDNHLALILAQALYRLNSASSRTCRTSTWASTSLQVRDHHLYRTEANRDGSQNLHIYMMKLTITSPTFSRRRSTA